MTYASEHVAYTFEGGLPGGEIWTVTLRTGDAVIDNLDAADAAIQAGQLFRTMWNATSSWSALNPASVSFLKCIARSVNAAGVTTAQGEWANPQNTIGIANGQTSPNQAALVVSLITTRPGRTGRGRVYMPILSPLFGVGTDRLATGTAQPLATAFAQFLAAMNLINSVTVTDWGPFPMSVQSTVNFAAPPPIITVRVGDVVDTQRRRRNKVTEVYSIATL